MQVVFILAIQANVQGNDKEVKIQTCMHRVSSFPHICLISIFGIWAETWLSLIVLLVTIILDWLFFKTVKKGVGFDDGKLMTFPENKLLFNIIGTGYFVPGSECVELNLLFQSLPAPIMSIKQRFLVSGSDRY